MLFVLVIVVVVIVGKIVVCSVGMFVIGYDLCMVVCIGVSMV